MARHEIGEHSLRHRSVTLINVPDQGPDRSMATVRAHLLEGHPYPLPEFDGFGDRRMAEFYFSSSCSRLDLLAFDRLTRITAFAKIPVVNRSLNNRLGEAMRRPRPTGFVAAIVFAFVASASSVGESVRDPDPQLKVYVVQMSDDPIVAYDGGHPGFDATRAGAGERLNPNNPRVRSYQDFLDRTHTAALMAAAIPAEAKFYDYRFSFNGFAALLTPGQAARLAMQPQVVAVNLDERRKTLTDSTPGELGLTGASGFWATGGPGGTAAVGEDVVIGVIDTGVWPEHPSFSDQPDFAYRPGRSGDKTRVYGPPPSDWFGACDAGEQWSQMTCNNKLIGARYFLQGLSHAGIPVEDYASARDKDGHGTHTASTAAGNRGVTARIFGRDIGLGTISGMAPRARIAAYKACFTGAGCAVSDLVAAIDAAVRDGVDVINFAIGGGNPSVVSPDAMALLFASDAGVFVATAAGDDGPGPGTISSPAASPWVMTVAANTHGREFVNVVTLGNGSVFLGASVTHGVGPARLVDGGNNCPELDSSAATGALVLCLRVPGIPHVSHSAGVAAAGGVGMILYDPPAVNVTPTDNHVLPTSTVRGPDGAAIATYIASSGAEATASFTAGTAALAQTNTEIAVFSSRGPNSAATDILKPDVTAPGVQILAGHTPSASLGASGQLFQVSQGTSMSSAHVAGIAALLIGTHPDWTPAMIRSALTTTASQSVLKHDGTTPADPFDTGGGHIAPVAANDPGLVYDAGPVDYRRFLCGSGLLEPVSNTCAAAGFGDPSDLNLATIAIGQLDVVQTVTRTVTNVGPAATYTVTYDKPSGIDVIANPEQMTLQSGETVSYEVTFIVEAGAELGEWAFGSLTWSDGQHNVRSPIAIRAVSTVTSGASEARPPFQQR